MTEVKLSTESGNAYSLMTHRLTMYDLNIMLTCLAQRHAQCEIVTSSDKYFKRI
jgi:hypothetical protein